MKKIVLVGMTLFMLAGFQSCYVHFDDPFCMSGSGNIVTEEFELGDFSAVENQTVIDVEIVQGEKQTVTVEGDANIINQLELYVQGGELTIDMNTGCYKNFNLKVYITLPTLDKVSVKSTGDVFIDDFEDLDYLTLKTSGTGDIIGTGFFEVNNLVELKSSSTGQIKIEVYTNDLMANVNGTGDLTLIGSCKDQDIEMNSTGDYKAFNFESETCTIRVSGTGDAKLNVSDELDARISGTGNIYYMGAPHISITDNGLGNLIRTN